jgi:hypothetical protein
MFCSGCGQSLEAGQNYCPNCGKPAVPAAPVTPVAPTAPPGPAIPGFDMQLRSYAGKVRVLAVLWFVYAALSLVAGFVGMAFARAFLSGAFGNWLNGPLANGPVSPSWLFPAMMHFAWTILVIRAVLAVVAGWGLMERAQWGRIVAIVAAVLALIRFPLGTALGIATLIILLGWRNTALYEQL